MNKKCNSVSAIIVAAGSGKRMMLDVKKQFIMLGKKPVLSYSLDVFAANERIKEIVLVVGREDMEYARALIDGIKKKVKIVEGGSSRQESVFNGLCSVEDSIDLVVVHDGARPFVRCVDLKCLLDAACKYGSATFGITPKDTIKVRNNFMEIEETLDRSKLVIVQTPQAFVKEDLLKAHIMAKEDGYQGTDDTVLMERCGIRTKVVEGSNYNIKITTREDLIVADIIKEELSF
ncbi:MAG: 2-C-methyl-D-erythritol 4-phosphate cytidylyltransferase [Clostridiales bacterium]|nr:2-C-methyl-D-erythritol 4-phosphate cytidylyltransferase [Clostridiales bacterium]